MVRKLSMALILLYWLRFDSGLGYVQSWWIFHECLDKTYVSYCCCKCFIDVIRSCWLIVLFGFSIFLLILCLIVLSVAYGGQEALKYPNIIVDLSLSNFRSTIFASCILKLWIHLGSLCLPAGLILLSLCNVFLYL